MKQLLMDTLEYTFDVISNPKPALDKVVHEVRLHEGLLIWVFTLLLPCLSAFVQMKDGSLRTAIGAFVAGAIIFLAQVICIHGMASILGGKGSIKSLAAGLGFSNIPLNFATLAESLVFLLPGSAVHTVSGAAFIWSVVLAVLVIRSNYSFSTERSVATLLLPIILLIVAIIAIVLCFVVSLVTLLKGF